MGTVWELDEKSSPRPFKKIRNIPWGYVCATQLAHPLKNKKHPWGHVGSTKLALLTCFILMCFFYGQATQIGASYVWN
jgi:hypothetical protein